MGTNTPQRPSAPVVGPQTKRRQALPNEVAEAKVVLVAPVLTTQEQSDLANSLPKNDFLVRFEQHSNACFAAAATSVLLFLLYILGSEGTIDRFMQSTLPGEVWKGVVLSREHLQMIVAALCAKNACSKNLQTALADNQQEDGCGIVSAAFHNDAEEFITKCLGRKYLTGKTCVLTMCCDCDAETVCSQTPATLWRVPCEALHDAGAFKKFAAETQFCCEDIEYKCPENPDHCKAQQTTTQVKFPEVVTFNVLQGNSHGFAPDKTTNPAGVTLKFDVTEVDEKRTAQFAAALIRHGQTASAGHWRAMVLHKDKFYLVDGPCVTKVGTVRDWNDTVMNSLNSAGQNAFSNVVELYYCV